MIADRIPQLAELTVEEKLLLANELWDEVERREKEIPFDDAVLKLLERRAADFQQDPSSAVTWEEFKRRLGKG